MELQSLLEKLESFQNRISNASSPLPDHDELLFLTDEALTLLESESESYRPLQDVEYKRIPGGLLDFTRQSLPALVIPDLHARTDFFLNILKKKIQINGEEQTVLEFLDQKKIYLIFLGDLFHAEGRERNRWIKAWTEWTDGVDEGKYMTGEMAENLALFQMVLTVKIAFPAHFHFLKGNHENILNEAGRGNHPFRKFADEGNMVYSFMSSHYGDAVLHVMSEFEHALPLCALLPNCVITHAEPIRTFTRNEIVNYWKSSEVVLGLTWTANDEAQEGSVVETEENLLGNSEGVVWLAGHRPVSAVFQTRQNGRFIQFHNPNEQNIALVVCNRVFNPQTDFINVESKETE